MTRGRFITVEGIEGVGKSTIVPFIQSLLADQNISTCVTREPGGTELAETIRKLLLSQWDEGMTAQTELLLMFAARSQHVDQVINPELNAGCWVICERFTDASRAYQGGGRGIPLPFVDSLADLVHGSLWPDLTIYLDIDVQTSFERTHSRGTAKDRIELEGSSFFEDVLNNYRTTASREDRYVTVDARQALALVQADVKEHVLSLVDRSR